MNDKYITLTLTAVGTIIGAIGIGYAFGKKKKLDDISNKLNRTIDDLSRSIDIDISDEVVEEAVERAAEREAKKAVQTAISKIISGTTADMRNQVTSEIERQKSLIKDDVIAEIKRKVSKLSIEDLKESVVNQARKEASEKLQSSMDDILESFNANLTQVGKIYQSIAQSFPNGKTITLT